MQSPIQIRNLAALYTLYPEEPEIWAVDLKKQRIHKLLGQENPESHPISSSRFGCGNIKGSLKTPLGPHRVCEIIGQNAALGQAFKSREPVGAPLTQWTLGEGDAILTRILWLDGLVPNLNHHSKARYIYIHGTHQEEKLGQTASQGCIRMGNQALATWTDALNGRHPLVWIGNVT